MNSSDPVVDHAVRAAHGRGQSGDPGGGGAEGAMPGQARWRQVPDVQIYIYVT